MSDGSDPTASTPRPRRRRWGWLVWLLLCAALIALRGRSFTTGDFVLLGTRGGSIQGIASHRGQAMLAFSTLPLGPERSWTIERDAVPAEQFDELYGLVYAWVDGRKDLRGFGFAQTQRGQLPGNATHIVFVAPHWALATLAGLPVLRFGWAALRQRRRRKRGLCRRCGYDLRGAGDAAGAACPECGEAVVPVAITPGKADGRDVAKATGNLVVTLLVAVAVLSSLHLAQPAPAIAQADRFSREELAAGLGRRIRALNLSNATPRAALEAVQRQAGVTFIIPDRVARSSYRSAGSITVTMRDVTLATALRIATHDLLGPPVKYHVREGSIVLGHRTNPDDLVLRAYDVRDVIAEALREPAPPGRSCGTSDGDAPPPVPTKAQLHDRAVEQLAALLADVTGRDWDDDALTGEMTVVGGRLLVRHTPEIHREIERLLAGLRAEMFAGH